MKCAVLFLSLAALWTVPAPADPTSEKQSLVSDTQVAGWVKRWQARLRLQDWRVDARIVRKVDLKPDTLGNLKWNSEDKTATIRILDPRDYDLPTERIPEDMELTVVHELIHLHLSVLPRDPLKKGVEEQVVDKISVALFNLERQGEIAIATSTDTKAPSHKGTAARTRQ